METIVELLPYIMICVLAPFAGIGVSIILMKIIRIIRVKKGWIELEILKPSGYFIKKFVRPKGGEIKLKEKIYTFSKNPGMIIFGGGTPTAHYLEDGTQLNLGRLYGKKTVIIRNKGDLSKAKEIQEDFSKIEGSIIDAETLSKIGIRTYNAGKAAAYTEMNIIKILLIIAVVAAGIAAFLSLANWQTINMLGEAVQDLLAK